MKFIVITADVKHSVMTAKGIACQRGRRERKAGRRCRSAQGCPIIPFFLTSRPPHLVNILGRICDVINGGLAVEHVSHQWTDDISGFNNRGACCGGNVVCIPARTIPPRLMDVKVASNKVHWTVAIELVPEK